MFTLYRIVKRIILESAPDRASVHTKNTAFEAVSAPEQYCSALLLKVERSVSDRFLKRFKSEHFYRSRNCNGTSFNLINDLFKSKGSVANCMTDRAPVHTGNVSEQFLYRSNF